MYHIYRNDGKHDLNTMYCTINIPGKQTLSMFSIVEKNTKIFIAIDEIGTNDGEVGFHVFSHRYIEKQKYFTVKRIKSNREILYTTGSLANTR